MPEQFISVVVPVFNAEDTVEELCSRIDNCVSKITNAYEIILVDDFSTDNTWVLLNSLYDRFDKVKIIRFMKNFGQHSSILCGMFRAKGDVVVTMDDDLQHRPEDIHLLVAKINEGHDIAMAYFKKKKHTLFRIASSKVWGYLNNILIGKPENIYLSSFRAFSQKVVKQMKLIRTSYPFFPTMMFSITRDVVNVPLEHCMSKKKNSTYTFPKYYKTVSKLFINNSIILLKITGFIGLLASFGSFVFAIILIVKKLFFQINVTGWASLIVSLYLIGGLILFSLGVIGEYLLRLMVETTDKPYYFIKEEKT